MDGAVVLLRQAVVRGERILVVGDFDADGATSTALALRALRAMGAGDVDYLVPNRFEYGYGLTPEIVEVAAGLKPDLIITVDNGVASIEGVAVAKARGIQVLVTDHHLPGERLPEADAMVNPNLRDDPFPSKSLAGVGVIFYVMAALRAALRSQGWFEERGLAEPNMAQFLDLVALGTVADVVALDHNNRILVEQGLRRIRSGCAIAGIGALLEIAGRNPRSVVASDLGFAVGPRLNAAGRLKDMSLGIECLLSDDRGQARNIAAELDALNRERREIEDQMQAEALVLVDGLPRAAEGTMTACGLCLYDARWHQGVIGILASRIKERYHRPVIAFADAGGAELKGSARSIPGLHIRDVLDALATTHTGLISRFGGHAMAAGLSLPRENLDAFREAFDAAVREALCGEALERRLLSDGELSTAELTLDAAETIRYGGPWGQGFPEPVFDGEFTVLDHRVVGRRHLKLIVRPREAMTRLDAIVFNFETHGWEPGRARVRLAYRLDVNEYQGVRRVQLVVSHLEPTNA
jgi:single-stranded-DNA-specific exonuclease